MSKNCSNNVSLLTITGNNVTIHSVKAGTGRTDTINYVYDGMLAIQMRGASISSYTRGLDLSQSLQGAGGIGGLLAQTASGAHPYYYSDGNGNITYLMKADQSLGASYRYDDAYGNVVTTSGTLSNPFRFSSKEWLPRISAYYYGYRFYYPAIQRWLNRDPAGETFDLNLYRAFRNEPLNIVDVNGLWPESIHNTLIDSAFPTLPGNLRDILKEASRNADSLYPGQLPCNSYKHGMSQAGEDPIEAKEASVNNIYK